MGKPVGGMQGQGYECWDVCLPLLCTSNFSLLPDFSTSPRNSFKSGMTLLRPETKPEMGE